jgi:hypothetical protein
LNDRKLDIHATLHNGASKEIAVYIGHPTGQWVLATHQALALSVTDNSEISYWLSSIEGIITQAEQDAGAYGIFAGPNQYVIVPPGSDAQVRFVFRIASFSEGKTDLDRFSTQI